MWTALRRIIRAEEYSVLCKIACLLSNKIL